MDTIENTNPTQEIPKLYLNDQSLIYLNETRKWGTFLSILGFIGIGLMVLLALFIGSSTRMKPALEYRNENDLSAAFGYLKSVFRFMGIMSIVILSLYVLLFIGLIVAALVVRH
jgi:uncharacterized oligopeptide transporter (OPT) family protein